MAEFTLLRFATFVGIGGSLAAVAVPAFVRALSASKLTEAMDGIATISTHAVGRAALHRHEESFPPGVALTPANIPRGELVTDPPGTWDHLTWRALGFRVDTPHAFSFSFESVMDPATRTARFSATARGDLDGDGLASTFQVQGERPLGGEARVLPGMLLDRELE